MRFPKRKSLIFFTILFAGLLIVHTVFTFYYRNTVKEYAQLLENSFIANDRVENETAERNDLIHSADQKLLDEKAQTVDYNLFVLTVLEVLLALSGFPLLFLLGLNLTRYNLKLTSLTKEIEENNKRYVFDSLDTIDFDNEVEVRSRLLSNLKKAANFIQAVSAGNYSIQWEGMTDANKDANRESIAGELIRMRDQMKLVKAQDEARIWTTEGLSKFGDIIRRNQDNFTTLAENLVSNVVAYVDAKVAGLFIIEEDEIGDKYLKLTASYAYDRKKYINKRIEIGEGLVGQSYIEARTIYITKVPENYVSITSGLGETNPSCLLIIPLKTNDRIEGVLEVASLKKFKPHEIEFLEKLGELLASSIVSVRTVEKTNDLLQVSQQQGEEMRAQEEEMRQNMEELEATQEQMNRTLTELGALKESLEKEKYLLDSLMDNIPDAIYFKDKQSKFIRVSKYLADHFNANVDELIGKSDFDFQDEIHASEAFEDEKNIMNTRQPKIDYVEKETLGDGTEHWVSTTKMPLVNSQGVVVGTFGISRDVTKIKRLELDVMGRDTIFMAEKKKYLDKIKFLEEKLKKYQSNP